MAKRTNKINEREREIVNMECENLRDISEDLDELMDGDDIVFEKSIQTCGNDSKRYKVMCHMRLRSTSIVPFWS